MEADPTDNEWIEPAGPSKKGLDKVNEQENSNVIDITTNTDKFLSLRRPKWCMKNASQTDADGA